MQAKWFRAQIDYANELDMWTCDPIPCGRDLISQRSIDAECQVLRHLAQPQYQLAFEQVAHHSFCGVPQSFNSLWVGCEEIPREEPFWPRKTEERTTGH